MISYICKVITGNTISGKGMVSENRNITKSEGANKMRKKEKKNLIENYEHVLLYYYSNDNFSKEEEKYYKGKIRGIEEMLNIVGVNYSKIKEDKKEEIKKDNKELDNFFKKYGVTI